MATSQDASPADAKPTRERRSQEYYDEIKRKFAEERDLRLAYRPEGTAQFHGPRRRRWRTTRSTPTAASSSPREPINDTVEVLFIGGGFSALLTSARLREVGVESIRIVERGADVGGTWYWNRYPGVACDVVAYDYLPLLDEMDYVPSRHYAGGEEIYAALPGHRHAATTCTSWPSSRPRSPPRCGTKTSRCGTSAPTAATHEGPLRDLRQRHALQAQAGPDRRHGDASRATRSTPRAGTTTTPAPNLENLHDKVVGIIGTGATAVQAIPLLGESAKELYVFQRTPSSIDIRDDWETDPEWAAQARSRAGRPSVARRR